MWGHVRVRIRLGMGSGRGREEHDGQRREQGVWADWAAGQWREGTGERDTTGCGEGTWDQTGLQNSIPKATEAMEGFVSCGSTR